MTRLDHGRTCPRCRGTGTMKGVPELPPMACRRCRGVGIVYATVRRETRSGEVIELRPDGFYIREKGRRTWYGPIAYGRLLLLGARQYVEDRKRTKAAASKVRRKR